MMSLQRQDVIISSADINVVTLWCKLTDCFIFSLQYYLPDISRRMVYKLQLAFLISDSSEIKHIPDWKQLFKYDNCLSLCDCYKSATYTYALTTPILNVQYIFFFSSACTYILLDVLCLFACVPTVCVSPVHASCSSMSVVNG